MYIKKSGWEETTFEKKERKRKHFKTCIVCSKPNGVLPNRLKHDFISLFCNVHCSRESLHWVWLKKNKDSNSKFIAHHHYGQLQWILKNLDRVIFLKSQATKLYGCECVSILCPMSIALFVLHDQPHEKNIFSLKQTAYLA